MAKMRMMGRKLSGELAAGELPGLKKSQTEMPLSLEGNRPNLTPVGTDAVRVESKYSGIHLVI